MTREDFEAVLDDFLAQEQLGNKLKPKLEGDTPQGKLDTIRRTLMDRENADERARREALLNKEDEDDAPILMPVDIGDKQDRWDCETILCTSLSIGKTEGLLGIELLILILKITLACLKLPNLVVQRRYTLTQIQAFQLFRRLIGHRT